MDHQSLKNGSMASKFHTYQRVHVNGDRGTIKFIGTVGSLPGEWLGIDWDDDSRGKHDGSYDGVSYFQTSGRKNGSFVRAGRVSVGESLLAAVMERYGQDGERIGELQSHRIGKKEVEFVGMSKVSQQQSRLERLRVLVLDGSNVSDCGDPDELQERLGSCTELDLTQNLLWDWSQVFSIVRHLSRLHFLNLSNNRFRPLTEADSLESASGSRVKHLALNFCRLMWQDANMSRLVELFPGLIEFNLCGNQITKLLLPAGHCLSLRALDLENNPLSGWDQIRNLSHLPNLESLNLTATGLDSVDCVPSPEGAIFFPALRLLYLSQNKIASWESVDELCRLSLEQLMLHENPVMSSTGAQTARQIVIAKIRSLKALDRVGIVAQERRGAEIDYLKRYGKEWLELGEKAGADFYRRHPRFLELVGIHGPPEESEVGGRPVQKGSLLSLTLVVGEKRLRRSLPASMTVQRLKSLMGRLGATDPRRLQLAYQSPHRSALVPLENDFRDLSFYDLNDGDCVYILKS